MHTASQLRFHFIIVSIQLLPSHNTNLLYTFPIPYFLFTPTALYDSRFKTIFIFCRALVLQFILWYKPFQFSLRANFLLICWPLQNEGLNSRVVRLLCSPEMTKLSTFAIFKSQEYLQEAVRKGAFGGVWSLRYWLIEISCTDFIISDTYI